MNMSPVEIQENIDSILGKYANAYLFTKALSERSILKKRGDIPCCIIRPSMIGSALSEPLKGWNDSVAATAVPILFGGLGLYGDFLSASGTGQEILDITAVDQCVNSIIIATCHCASHPEKLHVYNHCSSQINPLSREMFRMGIINYFKHYPFDN
jgi:nucleoside-diphosphate-sugar epimerase